MASASGCRPRPHWQEAISYPESSDFLVSDPCSYPADQEARRLWDRYETGWEMIDLTTSSALLTTPGTVELVGKEPPSPNNNVLNLMHGQETIKQLTLPRLNFD